MIFEFQTGPGSTGGSAGTPSDPLEVLLDTQKHDSRGSAHTETRFQRQCTHRNTIQEVVHTQKHGLESSDPLGVSDAQKHDEKGISHTETRL